MNALKFKFIYNFGHESKHECTSYKTAISLAKQELFSMNKINKNIDHMYIWRITETGYEHVKTIALDD